MQFPLFEIESYSDYSILLDSLMNLILLVMEHCIPDNLEKWINVCH